MFYPMENGMTFAQELLRHSLLSMYNARKTYINQTIRKPTFVDYVDFNNNMKYFTYFAKTMLSYE